MSEFYIVLPSNTKGFNPYGRQNTTSVFRVPLPHEIRLTGEWEVGLVEIIYPYSWNNITNNTGVTVLPSQVHPMRNNEIKIFDYSKRETPVFFSMMVAPGHYQTTEHLLAGLYHGKIEMVSLLPKEKQNDMKSVFTFGYDRILRRVTLDFAKGTTRALILSDQLQYMLGFKNQVIKDTCVATYPSDMRAGIDSLYIYCDLCEPQIVGDTKEQLLRIIPITGRYGDLVNRVFVAPHYVGVLSKEFASVEISIKTDTNQPISFAYGKSVLKLHFRKKRSS